MITNYVFGFGSLICSSSRAITGQLGPVVPVVVANIERSWTAHVDFASPPPNAPPSLLGATAVSVVIRPNANCCGILLKLLDQEELERLDMRESGYDRIPIPLSDISPVSSSSPLPPELSSPDNRFWCYSGRHQVPATPSHPILQSYVDVIIKGALEYSPEFAENFISTTLGWDGYWLNDRRSLIYARSEKEVSVNGRAKS